MSEEKLYAVKNDEGKFLSFSEDGCSVWHKAVGPFQTDKQKVREWAYGYGGHVVTLVEEPKKVVLSKEQAKIVEDAHDSPWPAGWIGDHTSDIKPEEELLMNAYVNGYTVAKEKKYNVKVPHTDDSYFYKVDDEYCNAGDSYYLDGITDKKWFTDAEIEHYGLQDCEKEEVTDDAD